MPMRTKVLTVVLGIFVASLGILPRAMGYSIREGIGLVNALVLGVAIALLSFVIVVVIANVYNFVGIFICEFFSISENNYDGFGKIMLLFLALGHLIFFTLNGSCWFIIGLWIIAATVHYLYFCERRQSLLC